MNFPLKLADKFLFQPGFFCGIQIFLSIAKVQNCALRFQSDLDFLHVSGVGNRKTILVWIVHLRIVGRRNQLFDAAIYAIRHSSGLTGCKKNCLWWQKVQIYHQRSFRNSDYCRLSTQKSYRCLSFFVQPANSAGWAENSFNLEGPKMFNYCVNFARKVVIRQCTYLHFLAEESISL